MYPVKYCGKILFYLCTCTIFTVICLEKRTAKSCPLDLVLSLQRLPSRKMPLWLIVKFSAISAQLLHPAPKNGLKAASSFHKSMSTFIENLTFTSLSLTCCIPTVIETVSAVWTVLNRNKNYNRYTWKYCNVILSLGYARVVLVRGR